MNVLHVDVSDLVGRRFNGYDLMKALAPRGFTSAHAALRKVSADETVMPILATAGDEDLQSSIAAVERRHSMNDLLYPWGRMLAETPAFGAADVVHYHNIHWGVVSLLDLPMLFALKPSVWTFHDPWPMTGHCLHPERCPGWTEGCSPCPHLDARFEMDSDCAGRMWRVKRELYADIDPHVIVASDFMLDMVRRSPLTSHFSHVHQVPFGIDTEHFRPHDRAVARRRLGIPADDFVLFFRAADWSVKGLPHIVSALNSRPPARPTTLLTVEQRGLVGGLSPVYRLKELGRVSDDRLMPLLYAASDAFLMPSTAESFGLMAIEAMACARPVICFEETAVAQVTHAPECGIAVRWGDADALRDAIDRLEAEPEDGVRRGLLGRSIAEREYGQARYVDAMAALYAEVARV